MSRRVAPDLRAEGPRARAWLTILAAPIPAGAQEKPADLGNQSLEDLMNVRMASVSKKEQTLPQTASAIFLIGTADARRSVATNIPDLLRRVPGVGVARIHSNTWAMIDTEQTKLRLSCKRSCNQWMHGHRIRPRIRCCLGKGLATSLLAVMASVSSVPVTRAQASPSNEYQVKAAFLLNSAKFIDWPASSFGNPQAPFWICIPGKDPFGRSIDDTLQGKAIGEHPISVQRLKDAAEARHGQILFARILESRNLAPLLEALKGATVLLVGDLHGFAASGGTIQLTLEEDHIRFLTNGGAADRAGLRCSSKLLTVGKIVDGVVNEGKS